MSVITIEAPVDVLNEEHRTALAEADIITGVDIRTLDEFTVYGTPPLESTITMKRPAAMRVVQVRLDGRGEDLKRLVALVRMLKSSG